MNHESKLWLLGAGGVALVVLAVVLIFGLSFAPDFPSLYEDGPTVEGTVAYIEHGPDDCLCVLDVATGEERELYCSDWVGFEGWDSDGNLRVHSGNGYDHESAIDPATGEVVDWGESVSTGIEPRRQSPLLRARTDDGRATLIYDGPDGETTLIDVRGPRDYAFWAFGITENDDYAWVCDSEDRLLVVALDGYSGPWLVAEDVGEPAWR